MDSPKRPVRVSTPVPGIRLSSTDDTFPPPRRSDLHPEDGARTPGAADELGIRIGAPSISTMVSGMSLSRRGGAPPWRTRSPSAVARPYTPVSRV